MSECHTLAAAHLDKVGERLFEGHRSSFLRRLVFRLVALGFGDLDYALVGGVEKGEFLNLPQERREQLKQAREQALPPGALPVFERYLELLEEKR